MSRIRAIAKAEFIATVTRKGYVIAVIALPVVLLVVPALSFRVNAARAKEQRVAIVDRAGIVGGASLDDLSQRFHQLADQSGGPEQGGLATLVRYDSDTKALADLEQGTLDGAYVISADYLVSGDVDVYRNVSTGMRVCRES